jgi:hypothetical protein
MRTRLHLALLFPLACLLGCTVPTTPATQTSASPSITGNWQIQSGTAITSPPTAPYLIGALQGPDSALTGTFNNPQVGTVSPVVVESYSGTYNASTSILAFNSTAPLPAGQITATLSVPANPTDLSTGTLNIMCGVCANGQQVQIVGAEIAPLNGTYTGTLTETITSPAISKTVTLVISQSTTPNSSGQFLLSGTFTWDNVDNILSSFPFVGTISGEGIYIEPTVIAVTPGPAFIITGYANPTATQITVPYLAFYPYPTVANPPVVPVYTGTLTLQ